MDPITPFNEAPPEKIQEMTKKDSSPITVVSVAIFVLLALAAVVFLYSQNQELKEKLATYEQVQTTPIPTPIMTPQESASPSATPKATKTPKVSTSSAVPILY